MKRRASDLSKEDKIRTLDALYTAASSVSGRENVKLFLRDLLTESERIMLGRRILIAQRIVEGKTRDEIAAEFGAGPDTVNKVQRWLYDQFPGYETALRGMKKAIDERKKGKSPRNKPYSPPAGTARHPLYRTIFKRQK